MHANTSDAQLLDHWRTRRDADAFAELVARYGPLVYSACLRVLQSGAAAEDAAQECFVDLIQSRKAVHSLPGFLHTAATRRALDRLRADIRRRTRETQYAAAQPPSTLPVWDDLCGYVDEAIEALPEDQRHAVVLRFLRGRGYAEMAAELNLPASTVQSRINRGIEGIRRQLAKRGISIGASALTGLLISAPSHAMPTAITAQLGTLALAGGVGTLLPVSAGASASLTFGSLIVMKQSIVILTLVAITALSAWYFLALDDPQSERDLAGTPEQIPLRSEPETVPQNSADATPALAETVVPVAALISDTGPRVAGVVLDADGNPAPDASVSARWRRGRTEVTTDAAGHFSIAMPPEFTPDPPGDTKRFRLEAIKDDFRAFPLEFQVPEAGRNDITLVLEVTGAISGRVVDADGNPLAGWAVVAHSGEGEEETESDDEGKFLLASLRTGEYELIAKHYDSGRRAESDRGSIVLLAADHVQDVVLVLREGDASISGYVTAEDGKPIPDTMVGIYFYDDSDDETKQGGLNTQTDESGHYELTGFPEVPPTVVHFQLFHPDYLNQHRSGVSLGGQEEDFVLLRCPVIAGHILDAQTRKPVTRFRIHNWPSELTTPTEFDSHKIVATSRLPLEDNADGEFSMRTWGYNTIKVAVAAPGYETAVKTLSAVAPGANLADVEILLTPAASLGGSVVDEAGAPIAGARIYLGYPLAWLVEKGNTGSEGVAVTGDDGTFTLTEYPPSLSVVSGYHPDFAPGWAAVSGAPIRIVLSRGAAVTGLVTARGVPVDKANIRISPVGEEAGIRSADTSIDGVYSITKVPLGRLILTADCKFGNQRHVVEREIHLNFDETLTQDFAFDDTGTATIEGVLLVDERPVPYALIEATITLDSGDEVLYQTEASQDGSYTLGAIPGGVYTVGSRWILQEDGSYLSPDMESIAVQEGETVVHDLRFTSR